MYTSGNFNQASGRGRGRGRSKQVSSHSPLATQKPVQSCPQIEKFSEGQNLSDIGLSKSQTNIDIPPEFEGQHKNLETRGSSNRSKHVWSSSRPSEAAAASLSTGPSWGIVTQNQTNSSSASPSITDTSSAPTEFVLEDSCPVCFPPLGGGGQQQNRMGNKTSASSAKGQKNSPSPQCTCNPPNGTDAQNFRKSSGADKNSFTKQKTKNKKFQKSGEDSIDLTAALQNLRIKPDRDFGRADIPQNVLYYGWFFDPEASSSIQQIADRYLRECIENVPQFDRFFQAACTSKGIRDPYAYYKKPGKVKPGKELLYHITAKFCDREPCPPYEEQALPFIGQKFKTHIVGLFFTEKTYGLRVKLTDVQQHLFDERENESNLNPSSSRSKKIPESKNSVKDDFKVKDPKCKSDIHHSYQGLALVRQKIDFHPTESRAHITIGCAPNIKAVQTGLDLIDIVDLEIRPAVFHQDYEIECGTLRQFGRYGDAFVIYPHHEIVSDATFKPFI